MDVLKTTQRLSNTGGVRGRAPRAAGRLPPAERATRPARRLGPGLAGAELETRVARLKKTRLHQVLSGV